MKTKYGTVKRNMCAYTRSRLWLEPGTPYVRTARETAKERKKKNKRQCERYDKNKSLKYETKTQRHLHE